MATDELSHVSVKYKPRELPFGWASSPWLMSASFPHRIRSTRWISPFSVASMLPPAETWQLGSAAWCGWTTCTQWAWTHQHRNSAVLVSVSGGFKTLFCCLFPFSSNFGSSSWWPVHQWSSPPPAPCFYPRRDPSDMWVNNRCLLTSWLICLAAVLLNMSWLAWKHNFTNPNIWLPAVSTSQHGAEGPKGPAAHPVKLTTVALIYAAICWPVLKLTHQQCARDFRVPFWKQLSREKSQVRIHFCSRITSHSNIPCSPPSPLLSVTLTVA